MIGPCDVLNDPKIAAILNAPYGRFSDQEFARRRAALASVMRERECDALLICGEQRVGTGVGWLTGWPTTTEALVLFMPGERDALWVEHYNHVPNARKIAQEAETAMPQRIRSRQSHTCSQRLTPPRNQLPMTTHSCAR